MLTTHLTFSTAGRVPVAPSAKGRLGVTRALARVAGARVAMFAVVDDHVHVVTVGSVEQRAHDARCLLLAWRALGVPLLPAFPRPVTTRAHAEWLVRYTLTQAQHHGIEEDPATAIGSWFPDLVGARRLAGLRLRLGDLLPRFQAREAYAVVGLPVEPIAAAPDAVLARLSPGTLVEIVAAAMGAAPGLPGLWAESVRARRVVTDLARSIGWRPATIAPALGVTATAAARLFHRSADPLDVRAARLAVALHEAAAKRRLAPVPAAGRPRAA